jgi:hypothetical protein
LNLQWRKIVTRKWTLNCLEKFKSILTFSNMYFRSFILCNPFKNDIICSKMGLFQIIFNSYKLSTFWNPQPEGRLESAMDDYWLGLRLGQVRIKFAKSDLNQYLLFCTPKVSCWNLIFPFWFESWNSYRSILCFVGTDSSIV